MPKYAKIMGWGGQIFVGDEWQISCGGVSKFLGGGIENILGFRLQNLGWFSKIF